MKNSEITFNLKGHLIIYFQFFFLTLYIVSQDSDPRPKMSLVKFKIALLEAFPDFQTDYDQIYIFVETYIDDQQKEFKQNKSDGKLQFGKYKGYKRSELALTSKGSEYIQWLTQQSWFNEEKYPNEFAELKKLGIKKKAVKRAPLE